MKKRYSFHHLKNVVIGATATMALSAICAPPVMAVSPPTAYTVSDAKTEPYELNSDDSLTVTSTGSITVVGEGTEIFSVGVDDDFNGTINNSGIIRVTATNGTGSEASAFGVGIDGNLIGSLTNTGTISATATSTSYATAFGGVAIFGDLLGSITNKGTITVNALSTQGYAYAAGIDVGIDAVGMGAGSSLINNGAITVTAKGDHARAIAIRANSMFEGASITNTGTLTATATGSSMAEGLGIYATDLSTNATITNSGAINVTANADERSGYVYGIHTGSLGDRASITNSGTITLRATSNEESATGYGIETGDLGVGASVRNSGVIDSRIISYNSSPDNYGISTDDLDENATITNSGTINVMTQLFGTGDNSYGGWASATGIRAGYLSAGAVITNSGTITATAEAAGVNFHASARGIEIGGLDSGASFINNGNITATATATDGYAYATGLAVYGIGDGASIVNNGTIIAQVSGDGAEGGAYGIRLNNLDENDIVTNNGTITATINSTGDENVNHLAYSIYIDNDHGTGGTVTNNGILNGNINLDGGNTYSSYYSGGEGGYSSATSGVISLNNNGTLAIPALAEGESGWISGDYTQGDDGIFKIGVQDNIEYGRLCVGGTATLPDNANIRVNVTPDNTLVAGTLEDIIDASEAPTTLYSGPDYHVMDNSIAWQFTASQDNDTLDLTAASTGMTSYQAAVESAGFSSGSGVSGMLDYFYNTSDSTFDDLLYVLGSDETPSEVADDVSKLMPLLSGGLSQATFNAMHSASRIIQARLETNQGLSFGDEAQPDRRMWVKPFGAWTDQDDADGAIGYDANTYGVIFGADTEVGSSYRLGAALAYSASDVDSNSDIAPQSVDIDTFQFALYGSYSIDAITEISFQADIGTSNYDGARTISFDSFSTRAISDFDSTNYHLGVGIGRDIKIDDKSTFTPSVRADYTAIDSDSYTETGADSLNLSVDGETYDELIFAVDGKITHDLNTIVSLTGNLGLGFDAINDQAAITSNFVGGGGAFVTNGIDPSALLFRGGLGLTMQPGNGAELVARYDIEAREDFANHTLSLKFRMPF